MQPNYAGDNLNLHYLDTESFLNTSISKTVSIIDLKDMQEKNICYDFCKVMNSSEIFSIDNENVLGKFRIENLEILTMDSFCVLERKEMHLKQQ